MPVKDGSSDTGWALVRTQYAGCCVILLFLEAVNPEWLFSLPLFDHCFV
jgi:hypothetical protein